MLKLYGLKNCDTCRKALKLLSKVELVDVRVDGVPQAVLEQALGQFGDSLLNTRSKTWRNLPEGERSTPPLELLQTHPALMKRPLIEREGELYLGWTKETQAALGVC